MWKDGGFLTDRDNRERCGARNADRREGEGTVTKIQAGKVKRGPEMDQKVKEEDHRDTRTICRRVEDKSHKEHGK